MKKTLWEEIPRELKFPTLSKDIQCDILIIGGGIAGISTAFTLKNAKKKVILIEKGRLGEGVSARTTGKLTFLQELIYQKLEKIHGFETAKTYLESQKEAIKIAKANIQKYHIDCNFKEVDSYTFTNKEAEISSFKKEEDFFKRANIKFQVVDKLPIHFPCTYGISVSNTAVFHPIKYILGLAKVLKEENFPIYENTKAETLTKEENHYIIKTEKYMIKAKSVIICTHYPFFITPGMIPLRTHIEKDYVGATKVKEIGHFSAITNTSPTHSIRFHEDGEKYLIYLSNMHKTNTGMNEEKEFLEMQKQFKIHFHKRPDYIWSTHDIITNDHLPMIGVLKENLLIATGFHTWGMTNGILSGKIISDILLKKENPYIPIFDPNRSLNLEKIKNFFLDLYQNMDSILKTKIKKQKDYYPENVIMKDGYGIYIDEKKKEHKVRNLCPHMKCSLIFNNVDKTWDCPCHGSRFSIDGDLIEGPSVYDIKEKP